MLCTHKILFGSSNQEVRWLGHVARMGERGEVHIGFGWGNMEGGHLQDPDIDGRIILKWIFEKWDGAKTGMIWLRIWSTGGLF